MASKEPRLMFCTSSLIQTLLSVLESHQISRLHCKQVADYTAGRESHPAPKNYFLVKYYPLRKVLSRIYNYYMIIRYNVHYL